MTSRTRLRVGFVLLVIVAVILIDWFVYSDLKNQLFDIPSLESQKQSIVKIISMTSANDQVLGEEHHPILKTPFCFWGLDIWTYKSSQSWAGTVDAFDQSFASWGKKTYPVLWERAGVIYDTRSGPFYVELEIGDAANTYIVRLFTNDPYTPQCGPD